MAANGEIGVQILWGEKAIHSKVLFFLLDFCIEQKVEDSVILKFSFVFVLVLVFVFSEIFLVVVLWVISQHFAPSSTRWMEGMWEVAYFFFSRKSLCTWVFSEGCCSNPWKRFAALLVRFSASLFLPYNTLQIFIWHLLLSARMLISTFPQVFSFELISPNLSYLFPSGNIL